MKNVIALAIGAFLVATAELVISGILDTLARSLNITESQAGQLVTAYSIGFAVGTPLLTALTTRMNRKTLALVSLLAFALANLAAALSGEYVLLLAARVVVGSSAGLFCVLALSSVAKLVGSDKIGSAMGTIVLAFSLSMVIGVPLGSTISNAWGWESIFYALAAGGVLVTVYLKSSLPQIASDSPEPLLTPFAVLRSWSVIGPVLLSTLLAASNAVLLTYMGPIVERTLQLPPDSLSLVLLTIGVLGIAGSQLGGIGVDKFGSGRMLLLSMALATAALALIPFSADRSTAFSLILIGIWGFSVFCTAPAINAYIVQTVPRSAHVVLSLNTSFTHLGLALGASAGGWLIQTRDSGLYHPWLGSILVFAALIVGVLSIRRPTGEAKLQSTLAARSQGD